MNQGNWFAVYTLPRWEKKVAEQLKKKRIECYCPQTKKNTVWSDRNKDVSTPLFSSYVFVYLKDNDLQSATRIRGVVNFVYWLGQPAVIRKEEIETIKRFLYEYPKVTVEKTNVNYADDVRVINEPVITRKGNVVEVKNTTVRAILPSLGQILLADVRKDNTELVISQADFKMTV